MAAGNILPKKKISTVMFLTGRKLTSRLNGMGVATQNRRQSVKAFLVCFVLYPFVFGKLPQSARQTREAFLFPVLQEESEMTKTEQHQLLNQLLTKIKTNLLFAQAHLDVNTPRFTAAQLGGLADGLALWQEDTDADGRQMAVALREAVDELIEHGDFVVNEARPF